MKYTTGTVLVLTDTVLGVVCADVLVVIVGIIMRKAVDAKIIKWIATAVFSFTAYRVFGTA
jgi:putative Ca2+/H+ antiporter (TMEM165/GDT1 family)